MMLSDKERKKRKVESQKRYYQAHKEEYAAVGRARRIKHKDELKISGRAKHLRVSYGLTIKQHKQMYLDQDGCCLLCDKPIEYSKVHTDHDHSTGRVRGLLCARCNLGMCFIDDADFMQRTIEYVK